MVENRIVSRQEWLAARKQLLIHERGLTRLRDEINQQRRELPWVRVEKTYVFDGPHKEITLGELFAGRSQLAVYHFMLAPESEHICDGCAFLADHVDAARQHFEQNDLSFTAISRAPMDRIAAVKERMGWRFQWVSSLHSDFNFDFDVSFTDEQIRTGEVAYNYGTTPYAAPDLPGTSIFYRNAAGLLFHTYSCYARGGDLLLGAYNWLDLTPKGRNETSMMDWVRLHDEYESHSHCCH